MSEYIDLVARAQEKLEEFKRSRVAFDTATQELSDARKELDAYAIKVQEIAANLASELDNYVADKPAAVTEDDSSNAVDDGLSNDDSVVEESNTNVVTADETAVSDESPEPKKVSRKSSRSTKAKDEDPSETVDVDTSAEPETDSDSDNSTSSDLTDLWSDDDDDDVDLFGPATPSKTQTAASGSKGGLFDSTDVDEVQF